MAARPAAGRSRACARSCSGHPTPGLAAARPAARSRAGELEDLAQQAADDALVAVLRQLGTFEGRSRFTTWAYKFGVLHAGVAVRRQAWRHREVPLPDTLTLVDTPHTGRRQ